MSLGTHIRIPPPTFVEEAIQKFFFNRKGFYSWNCLGICDDKLKFRFFTAEHPGLCKDLNRLNWPFLPISLLGSFHDTKIFKDSTVRSILAKQFDHKDPKFLIGDSGYQTFNYLLSPFKEDQIFSTAEKKYNETMFVCRILIEHAFG